MSEHATTIVEGTALSWAQCTCGWMGPSRPSKTKAELDLVQHRSWIENDPDTLDRFGRP